MTDDQIRTGSIDELTPDPRNANQGTERGHYVLDDSILQLGAGRSIVADKNGVVVAGNKTLQAYADNGGKGVVIVRTHGDQLVVVQREDWDAMEQAPNNPARRYAYADNRAGELSLEWDPEVIAADFEAGFDFDGMWSDEEFAEAFDLQKGDGEYLDVTKDAKPNPRILPIDVIYTLQMADCTCCLAVQAGLKYGIQSAHYRICPYVGELSGRHKIIFIDNDYFDYDHGVHLETVKKYRPKYATVRDIMSRKQCAESSIVFYEFEQIMDWAEELAEYAENVIVVPKYDCIADIPESFMLGYSVPTSHGGTPLPVELFKGRRVHLLGGSWKAQLAHMAQLGDDVVSLDNNHILNISRFGQYVSPNGETAQLNQIGFGYLTNARYTALALSFGAIGAKLNELYPQAVDETRLNKTGDYSV